MGHARICEPSEPHMQADFITLSSWGGRAYRKMELDKKNPTDCTLIL
jgi:hypothetical protein